MNLVELRQLAEDRLRDAAALLAAGQFSGAYYLAGYAVECGLKACILAHIEKHRCYLRGPEVRGKVLDS